jgi:hypothetical protein
MEALAILEANYNLPSEVYKEKKVEPHYLAFL